MLEANSSQYQIHLIRLTITIRKVQISVRFPCTLTFTLKSDKQSEKSVDNLYSYQLKNKQAIVNQSLIYQTQIQYDLSKKKYIQKNQKISLIVNMTSANGKIPAGNVQINITNQDIQKNTNAGDMTSKQQNVILQRCPDKNAKINFLQTIQYVKKLQGATGTTASSANNKKNLNTGPYSVRQHLKTQDSYSVSSLGRQKIQRIGSSSGVSGVSGGKNRNFKGSVVSQARDYGKNQYQFQKSNEKQQQQQIQPTYGSGLHSNTLLSNAKSMDKQITSSRYNNPNLPPKYSQRTRIQARDKSQIGNRNTYQNSTGQRSGRYQQRDKSQFDKDGAQSRVSRVSSKMSQLMLQNQQNQLQEQKKKIIKLQKQRAQHIKQLAKLRGQVQSFQMQNENNQLMQEEIYKLRDQNDQLYIKMDKLQQKNRQLQLKERQFASKIKQMKQELQQKSGSAQKNQKLKSQIQTQISTKQKIIRELQIKVKTLQTKIQDLTIQNSTQQKRIDFKENAYKQQLKKMSQKYNQSETERQKASFDLNNMLMDFQSNQKKNQNLIKQKQRSFNQQKSKLMKKIQTLAKQISQIEQLFQQRQNKIQQLQKKLKIFEFGESQVNGQNQRLTCQLELSNDLLKKQIQQRKNLQKQLQILKEIQNENMSLNKKLNDSLQQAALLKVKLQASQNFKQQLQLKCQSLQGNLREISNEKIQKQRLANKLLRQTDVLKRQEQKRIRQAQTLSVNHYNTSQKAHDLRMKLDAQILKYQTLSKEYNQQVTYYIKIKEQMETEMEDLRWSIDQQKQKNQQFIQQIKTVNQQKLKIHHQNLELAQSYSKLGDQLRDAKTLYYVQKQKCQRLDALQKQISIKLRDKNQRIRELQIEVSNKDHLLSKLKDKIIQYQILLAEKEGRQRQLQKDQNQLISKKNEEYSLLQRQIYKKNDKIGSLQRQIKVKQMQAHNLQEQIKSLILSVRQYQDASVQSQSKIQKLNQKVNKLKHDLNVSTQQTNNERKAYQKLKRQWEEYNQNVQKIMEQLLQQVAKDQVQSSSATRNLYVFQDTKLSFLQVEILKKRNLLILGYRQKLAQKDQRIKFNEAQLNKLKRYSNDRQKQFQIQQKRWKDQLSGYLRQMKGQKSDMFQKLQTNQKKLGEVTLYYERMKGQLQNTKLNLQQKIFQVQQLIKENDSLYEQSKATQDSFYQLKAQAIKQKKQYEEKLASLKENLGQQIQKYKNKLSQQQKKAQSLQKTLSQRQDMIERFKKQILSYQIKLDRISNDHSSKTNQINELVSVKQIFSKQRQTFQKQIKQCTQSLQKKQTECTKLQLLSNELQLSLTKIKQENMKIIIQVEKLKTENQLYVQTNKDLEDQVRQLRERMQKGKSLSNEKQINQSKQMNEKIIELSSKLQIAEFINKQNQTNIQELTSDNQYISNQLERKKLQIENMHQQLSNVQTQLIEKRQGQQFLRNQTIAITQQLQNYKQKIREVEEQLIQYSKIKQQLLMKDRQLLKLRQQRQNSQKHYQKSMNQLRTSMVGNRRQMVARNSKQQQQRVRIRQLERLLEQREMDLASQKRKWQAQADKQRKQIQAQLELLQKANNQLQQQYSSQREQLNNQIDSLTHECINLQGIIAQKQQLLRSQDIQINQYEKKIDDLTQQLKNCLQVWDKQKTTYLTSKKQMNQIQSQMNKFQRYAVQLDNRSKQLIQVSKSKIKQGNHPSVNDMLRQVSMALTKMKTKTLGKINNQNQKINIINDFKGIQQKIEVVLNSDHGLR